MQYELVEQRQSGRQGDGRAHGESYGLAHTPARFAQSWLRPGTPLSGLYLTGQDTLSAGAVGASSTLTLSAAARAAAAGAAAGAPSSCPGHRRRRDRRFDFGCSQPTSSSMGTAAGAVAGAEAPG